MAKKKTSPKKKDGLHLFPQKDGKWSWHLLENGRIVDSGEGHRDAHDAMRAARSVQQRWFNVWSAVNDKTGKRIEFYPSN